MKVEFCCEKMIKNIGYEVFSMDCEGVYLDGDKLDFCPFCGKPIVFAKEE